MAKVKRISQETFDAAVKENMEDFGMSIEDAIRDTTKEFQMQGIDLSNIVTSAANGEHAIVASAKRLSAAVDQADQAGCKTEIEFLLANIPGADEGKVMAVNNRVIESCGSVLGLNPSDQDLALITMRLLFGIVADHALGRDKFSEQSKTPVVKAIIEVLNAQAESQRVQELGFRLVKAAATKNEATKAAFMQHGGLAAITAALKAHVNEATIVRQVAGVIHTVTNADDYSTILSKVFDTSKELVAGGVLPLIYDGMRAHASLPDVLQDLLAALKGCAIQNDIVQCIMTDGGLQLALDALRSHLAHPGCASRCLLLLANMAENDDVKKDLCQGDSLPLLLAAMQAHAADPRVLRSGCAALASLALRMPDNCVILMAAGADQILVESMRAHPSHSELNRTAMIAVRNLVVRNPEHRQAFLDDGAEELVRRARDTHLRCGDAAFDCLRDLGCEYGGLGDRAGRGEHSAYAHCEDSLLKGSQVARGSAMISWEEED